MYSFELLGEVTERLKVQHWKCCVPNWVPRVRIPVSPYKKTIHHPVGGFFVSRFGIRTRLAAKQTITGFDAEGAAQRIPVSPSTA